MKQEDKELLFRDLCARLPYKTKIQLTEYSDLTGEKLPSKIKTLDYCMLGRAQAYCKGFRKDKIKPYLFPLSNMTEEQKTSHNFLKHSAYASPTKLIDWYNKNHFDFRGLIPKELAINATNLNIY